MSREFDRRTVLQGSFVLIATGFLSSCALGPKASPLGATTAPSSRFSTASSTFYPFSHRPEVAKSYGPNGTHYPADVIWMGDVAATEIVANCDWADIGHRISTLTAAQVAAGVAIRVRRGTLNGQGSNSGSPPVLAQLGDPTWARNVLICPLEGFGSVVIDGGIRLDGCTRLSLYGFLSSDPFVLTQCVDLQVGWSRFGGMNVTRGGVNIAFYELVTGFRRSADDTSGVRPTEDFAMTNILRSGCVFGPSVKPAGSAAHCDTIQMEGTGTGEFGPLLTEDCVDYGSSNSAELLSAELASAEYRHCLILADRLPWTVFPLQSGDYDGVPNAFAGGCTDVRLFDSIVVGAVGAMGFTEVSATTLSYSPQASQQPRDAGKWTVDASTASWTRKDIMSLQELSDYANDTLAAVWQW